MTALLLRPFRWSDSGPRRQGLHIIFPGDEATRHTVVAKKSAGLSFYYILVKSASNDFIQVVDIN